MNYQELMQWLRFEFPQCAWLESTIFGDRCIAAFFGKKRVIVRIIKDDRIGVDLDMGNEFCGSPCRTIEEARSTIIYYLKRINKDLIEDVQMALF